MKPCATMLGTLLFCGASSLMTPPASAQPMTDPYCQILDRVEEPIWQTYSGYVDEGRINAAGDTGLVELGIGSGLLYFRTPMGEFDLKGEVDTLFFTSSAGLRLPSMLAAARLDLDYTIRMQDGYGLQLGFAPGAYSELFHLDGDHFFYPFRIHGVRALTPNVSVLAGLNFYPDFDRLIDPRVGVRWALSDYLLIDLFYPKTEIVFRPNVDWALRMGVEINDYQEYQLKSGDERDRLMLDETRIFLGVDYLIRSDVQVMVRVGRVVERSIEFGSGVGERDFDNAYYFRIGLGGRI